MKPAFVIVEYVDQQTVDGSTPVQWVHYGELFADLDDVTSEVMELELRLRDANLIDRVRVRIEERAPARPHHVAEAVNACLSDQHLGWPVALDEIELREVKRTVALQGRALEQQSRMLEQILGLLGGGAAPPAPAAAPSEHMYALGPNGERVRLHTATATATATALSPDQMAAAMLATAAPPIAAQPTRHIGDAPIPFEVDERAAPPSYLDGAANPLVPVMRVGGGNSEQVAPGARANVTSRGFGIGGPSAKSEVEVLVVKPDGTRTLVASSIPKVGETLRHHDTSNEYGG